MINKLCPGATIARDGAFGPDKVIRVIIVATGSVLSFDSLQNTIDHDLTQSQIVGWIAQLRQLAIRESGVLDLFALGQEIEQRLIFKISSPAEVIDQIVRHCINDG